MEGLRKLISLVLALALCFALMLSPGVEATEYKGDIFDLNGDNSLSDMDAVYLLFYTFFPEDYPVDQPCDYDRNGQITDQDAVYLLFHIFFPTEYPISDLVVEWHQCPDAVKDFLENVTYDPNDYSVSYVQNYLPENDLLSNTKPIGVKVGNDTYYNQVPLVENAFNASGVSGVLIPLDRLRWINGAADNMRDLGGWQCDGGTVKYGVLYRSGELYEKHRDLLVGELGIKRELNLRGAETANTVSALGEDVLFYRPEVFKTYSFKNNPYLYESIKFTMDGAINGEPVIFHCYAGADRTEIVAFILEALLGVSQGDIDKDYELTMFYKTTVIRTRNNSDYQKLINEINAYDGDTVRDKVINLCKSIGITAEEINAFRHAMINGMPEDIS